MLFSDSSYVLVEVSFVCVCVYLLVSVFFCLKFHRLGICDL